jgi:hypothetical protein
LGDVREIDPTQEKFSELKELQKKAFRLHEQEPAVKKGWQVLSDSETRITMGLPQYHRPIVLRGLRLLHFSF